MKLKRLLLRYYPPALLFEYENTNYNKTLDLLDINDKTDITRLAQSIKETEQLSDSKLAYLNDLLKKLQAKIIQDTCHVQFSHKVSVFLSIFIL
jgi:dynein assembly factor with WDR repeat domains 1